MKRKLSLAIVAFLAAMSAFAFGGSRVAHAVDCTPRQINYYAYSVPYGSGVIEQTLRLYILNGSGQTGCPHYGSGWVVQSFYSSVGDYFYNGLKSFIGVSVDVNPGFGSDIYYYYSDSPATPKYGTVLEGWYQTPYFNVHDIFGGTTCPVTVQNEYQWGGGGATSVEDTLSRSYNLASQTMTNVDGGTGLCS